MKTHAELVIDRATNAMAKEEAEQKDNKVWVWIKEHGIRRVLFKRWVFVWCDMKDYRG